MTLAPLTYHHPYFHVRPVLEEALRVVIRFAKPNVVTQAAQYGARRGSQSSWANPPADDPAFQEQCRKFKEKYSELEAT